MTSTLFITQFVLTIVLTIAVLLQKSSSIGLGAYSGSNDSVFGAKGPANFLTKFTFIVGFLFVVNTITLGYLYNQERLESAVDTVDTDSLIPAKPKAKEPAPDAPQSPVSPQAPQTTETPESTEAKVPPAVADDKTDKTAPAEPPVSSDTNKSTK